MDLSRLSADLPLSQPIDDAVFSALNKELSEEFKVGARSIAALYRLSNSKTQMVHAKGYLDCINDVLKLIETNENIKDIKDVLETKKREFTNDNDKEREKEKPKPTTIDSITNNLENNAFTINKPTQFHFPLTQTPISINPQLKYPPMIHKQKRSTGTMINTEENNHVEDIVDNNESDNDDDDDDDTEMGMESLKRKFLNDTHIVKKPKYDELC